MALGLEGLLRLRGFDLTLEAPTFTLDASAFHPGGFDLDLGGFGFQPGGFDV
jgi:hypothetical protein